jgi:IMP dehydrogenase/GMP reductase
MLLEGLTFDDVLLVPKYSTVESRSKIDISVKWGCFHYEHPIIPANMQTVTGKEMAIQIIKSGGLAILHRFMDEKSQLETARFITAEYGNENFAVSVGVKKSDREIINQFHKEGVRIICIDIAHGDSQSCIEMIGWIKTNKPDIFVIAGNVSTGEGAERLWRAGADVVKVGVGPGSLCTTRIETGNGVPQLTALMEVSKRRENLMGLQQKFNENEGRWEMVPSSINKPMYIIADGGIKSAGDIVKALCFADMVMVGNLFAGCEETPGKMMVVDGTTYKEYVGSSTHKTNHVEGVAALVRPKGTYKSVLEKLVEGVRSGCSYQGAHTLAELRSNPTFVRITNAGLKESHPHDVIVR